MIRTARGFTLLEVMVVITIIGLLATVILASVADSQRNARDARRASDIREIQKSLELYRNANGLYPSTVPAGSAPNNVPNLVINMNAGTYNITTYLPTIPTDPIAPTGGNGYLYLPSTDRLSYTLSVIFEKRNNGLRCKINQTGAVGTASTSIQALNNCF